MATSKKPAIDLDALSSEQLRKLSGRLAEMGRREAQRIFYRIFPDEDSAWHGPSIMGGLVERGQPLYCRDKYPRHMEFFEAGATYRERCFMAANRCLTAATVLDTPDGRRLVRDLYQAGLPFRVWAWDGQRAVAMVADAPFQKPGRPECYRVTMADGSWFECSGAHRLLTESGAYAGLERLIASGQILLESSSAHGPIVRGVDGRHSIRTLPSFPARYLPGRHPDDGQLPCGQGIGLVSAPLPAGVLGRTRLSWLLGGLARRCTSSLSALLGRPSTLYDADPRAALFFGFAGQAHDTTYAPGLGSRHSGWQFAPESAFQSRLNAEVVDDPAGEYEQPCAPPFIINANRIVSCHAIGRREVYDFTVPGLHNYITAGVIHHNTGKTFGGGGYETACHLTGIYPKWWKGRRFKHPISAWAAGDTYETTRDVLQLTLLGEVAYDGSRKVMDGRGIIPGEKLGRCTWRSGVTDLVDKIAVRHITDGWSILGLKSYDQGRKAFQGTGRHVIWLDEEPPMDVYNECLIRTATLDGIAMLTFTPLSGLSEVVLSFMPADQRPDMAA